MVQMKRLRETYSYFQSIREDMKLDDDDDDGVSGESSVKVKIKPSEKERKASVMWGSLGSMAKVGAFGTSTTGRGSFATGWTTGFRSWRCTDMAKSRSLRDLCLWLRKMR